MTAPLVALAATWDRLGIVHRRWLRGTGIRIGPLHPHTHSVISGLIFTGLGVVFLRYRGTAGLTGLLAPPSLDTWNNCLQDAVAAVQAHVPDLALIATVAAAVVAISAWRLHRVRRPQPTDTPGPAQQPALTEHAVDEPAPERTP